MHDGERLLPQGQPDRRHELPAEERGWALEIALDVETAHAICQNCKILLVEAISNSTANLGAAENEAVALGASVDLELVGRRRVLGRDVARQAYFNHPGVVITASRATPATASSTRRRRRTWSPWAGRRSSLNADNSYKGETRLERRRLRAARRTSRSRPCRPDSGCARRTVADVSADADPNTGAAIYDTVRYYGRLGPGRRHVPRLAADRRRLRAQRQHELEHGSAPYANPGALHDVTSGSQRHTCSPAYLCTAGVGYDGPTGLGTPNGLAAFGGGPAAPGARLLARASRRRARP